MTPKIWAPPHPKQTVQNKFEMSSLYEQLNKMSINIKIPTKIKKAFLCFITFYSIVLPINKKKMLLILDFNLKYIQLSLQLSYLLGP